MIKYSLLCKKLNYCGNYLKLLRLPNSKKNSFRINCMRKNGKVENYKTESFQIQKKNSFRFNCMRKYGKVEIFLKQREVAF